MSARGSSGVLALVTGLVVVCAAMTAGAQNLFNQPESVVYDAARHRYLVSNWGDGAIVQVDSNGVHSYFSTALMNQFRLIGLYLVGDTLLAAAGDAPNAGLAAFDLETAALVSYTVIPGVGLPNDIAIDGDGVIYVTDYWGDKLYKIENNSPVVYIGSGLDYPNGMVYDDRHNRLLIASVMGTGTPIMAVDLDDASISTVVTTGFYGTDGITLDANYRVYITSGGEDAVYRYDPMFSGPAELFSSGHSDPADIYYDRVNGVVAVPNLGSDSVDFVPVPSSDGGGTGRLAYCRQPESGTDIDELYTVKLDGTENRKIGDATIGLNYHDWSPDGQKLAATGYVNPSTTWSIYVFNADGGNLTRLTHTNGVWDHDPAWSPDGSQIAFTRYDPGLNREEIWIMNSDGSDPHWIGVEGGCATWSPAEPRLIYHAVRPPGDNYDIYTCNTAGLDEIQLTSSPSGEISPVWSPDGNHVAFTNVGVSFDHDIYVMDFDGTNRHQLLNIEIGSAAPRWSPNGALIAFHSEGEVYFVNADGTDLRQVTNSPEGTTAIFPAWQPVNSATTPVYLAAFQCTQQDDCVKIKWSVREEASVADFRLDAVTTGNRRSVPVTATGPRSFLAVDDDPRVADGGSITYNLYSLGDGKDWELLRAHSVQLAAPSATTSIRGVYPNPFNPHTTVSFSITHPQRVTIEIHDAAGRKVKTLADGEYAAGDFEVYWNGRDGTGLEAASGVYFLRFKAGKRTESRKLVLIR